MSKADYTGQINAKKLGGTGITEAMIARHHHAEAGQVVIVASVSVAATGKNVKEGTGSVHYIIDDLEVAPTTAGAADHVRDLIRSFEYERRLETEGKTLFDDRSDEPTVDGVVAAGAKNRLHPFLPANSADDNGICDVCGFLEGAPIHDEKPKFADPFTAPDPERTEEPADEEGATGGPDGPDDGEQPADD